MTVDPSHLNPSTVVEPSNPKVTDFHASAGVAQQASGFQLDHPLGGNVTLQPIPQ